MAADMIARMMAMSNSGGSGSAVQSDWEQTDTTAEDYIKNKPDLATVATSGSYADLTNKPTIPAAQVQADWNQADTNAPDFIKNKPTLGTAAAKGVDSSPTDSSTNLVESGGVYTALSGKADSSNTFTKAEVNADQQRQDAEIGSLVDRGAKNLSPVNTVIFTRPTGAAYTDPIAINLASGEYVVRYKLTTTANAAVAITYDGSEHLFYDSSSPYSDTVITHKFTVVNSGTSFRFYFNQAATVSELMLCTAADYAASTVYQPYAPTNRELYEMIVAMQSGT